MNQKQLDKYSVKADKVQKSLKVKKLKTANTVINKNTEIDQDWLDANPGPYSVQGGSETNIIEISFLENLNVKQDTYFMIETDYVNINGNGFTLNFENISDFVGLVQNEKSSNINVTNIRVNGKNSSLLENSGWILGSNFGTEAENNKVLNCTNYLPITIRSGGIVGNNSKIHAIGCRNNGEFKLDNSKLCRSGGIAGINVSGKIEYCYNYSDLEGRAAGIVHYATKDLDITNCGNYGKLNNTCAGIIGFVFGEKPKVNILNCFNIADLDNLSGGIIIGVEDNAQVLIKDCRNWGNCFGRANAGIMQTQVFSNPEASIEITDCTNYGNLNKEFCSGIIYASRYNLNINNCVNYGEILNYSSSGINLITYKPHKNIKVENCTNHGNILGKNSGGICTKYAIIKINKCVNNGTVTGTGSGGIFGAGTAKGAIAENCVNNGVVNGVNTGGIFGAWSQGTAKSCKNGGKLIGLSAQPILGYKSTGKIE